MWVHLAFLEQRQPFPQKQILRPRSAPRSEREKRQLGDVQGDLVECLNTVPDRPRSALWDRPQRSGLHADISWWVNQFLSGWSFCKSQVRGPTRAKSCTPGTNAFGRS
jgi:hypothetical protein